MVISVICELADNCHSQKCACRKEHSMDENDDGIHMCNDMSRGFRLNDGRLNNGRITVKCIPVTIKKSLRINEDGSILE